MQKSLPIKDIVIQSWDLIKENYVKLMMTSMLYFIFAMAISIYNFITINPETENLRGVHYLLGFVWFILFIYISVRFHRIFLLPSNETSNSLWFEWHSRETNFLIRWLIIILWMFLIMIPCLIVFIFVLGTNPEENSYSMDVYSIVSITVVYYFISRFSLVLPAAAVDSINTSTKWSWRCTRGNGFRLFILLSFLPILVDIISSFLSSYMGIYAVLFTSFLNILIIPFSICFLSLAYRFFMENELEEDLDESSLQNEVLKVE